MFGSSGYKYPVIAALYLAGLTFLLLSSLLAWHTQETIVRLSETNDTMRELLLQSEELFSLIKDAQNSTRGYVQTGKEAFLKPYLQAVDQFDDQVHLIHSQMDKLADDRAEMGNLINLMQLSLARYQSQIGLVHAGKMEQAQETMARGQGERMMAEIRQNMIRLQEALQSNLDQNNKKRLHEKRFLLRALIVTGVSALFMLIVAAWLALHEMQRRFLAEQNLQVLNHELENRVAERTQALQYARDRLKLFAENLTLGGEAERKRLAREVHDQLGQTLTLIKLHLRDRSEARQMVDEAIAISRRISLQLRPSVLDDLGLEAALVRLAEHASETSGMTHEVHVTGDARLHPTQAIHLYRIAQEAVTNVLRHAQASRLVIRGQAGEEAFSLSIEDDGVGCLGIEHAQGSGMLNIRERAIMLGGQATTGVSSLGGCAVEITIPFQA